MSHARCWWLTALLGVLAVPVTRGEEALAVGCRRTSATKGCDVRVTVRIDRDPRNRVLAIEADSADYFRGSVEQLPQEQRR